jgi:hypothetical protein
VLVERDAATSSVILNALGTFFSGRAAATGPSCPPPMAPARVGVGDIVTQLDVKVLAVRVTGQRIPAILGATAGELIYVEGKPVQVYIFASAIESAAAATALETQQPRPYALAVGNALVTVITDDPALAGKIIRALQAL